MGFQFRMIGRRTVRLLVKDRMTLRKSEDSLKKLKERVIGCLNGHNEAVGERLKESKKNVIGEHSTGIIAMVW